MKIRRKLCQLMFISIENNTNSPPINADWKDRKTLADWLDWFKNGEEGPTGRFAFTTGRHYKKDSMLMPSGLLGTVKFMTEK